MVPDRVVTRDRLWLVLIVDLELVALLSVEENEVPGRVVTRGELWLVVDLELVTLLSIERNVVPGRVVTEGELWLVEGNVVGCVERNVVILIRLQLVPLPTANNFP